MKIKILNMKESGKVINLMVKENKLGKMVHNIRVNLLKD
jgi:hypothetical protein